MKQKMKESERGSDELAVVMSEESENKDSELFSKITSEKKNTSI